MDINKLRRRQVHDKLEDLRAAGPLFKGVVSWIDYIRKGLGMSVQQLAQRCSLTVPALYKSIRMEKEDRMTLKKLREIGHALDCELVYALVPRRPMMEIIEDQAYLKAKKIVQRSHGHMELEDQALSKEDLKEQIQELAERLINDKSLWDKE